MWIRKIARSVNDCTQIFIQFRQFIHLTLWNYDRWAVRVTHDDLAGVTTWWLSGWLWCSLRQKSFSGCCWSQGVTVCRWPDGLWSVSCQMDWDTSRSASVSLVNDNKQFAIKSKETSLKNAKIFRFDLLSHLTLNVSPCGGWPCLYTGAPGRRPTRSDPERGDTRRRAYCVLARFPGISPPPPLPFFLSKALLTASSRVFTSSNFFHLNIARERISRSFKIYAFAWLYTV